MAKVLEFLLKNLRDLIFSQDSPLCMSASGRSVCPPGPGGVVSPPSSPHGRCNDNDSDSDDNMTLYKPVYDMKELLHHRHPLVHHLQLTLLILKRTSSFEVLIGDFRKFNRGQTDEERQM